VTPGAARRQGFEPAFAAGVLDREVASVEVVDAGRGYTPACPLQVRFQTPQESGGVDGGKPAEAKAVLGAPPGRAAGGAGERGKGAGGKKPAEGAGGKKRIKEAAGGWVDQSLSQQVAPGMKAIDERITRLLPPAVSVAFDAAQGRFSFVETTITGLNVTFGPSEAFSSSLARSYKPRPVEREQPLDLSIYYRLAASGAICASGTRRPRPAPAPRRVATRHADGARRSGARRAGAARHGQDPDADGAAGHVQKLRRRGRAGEGAARHRVAAGLPRALPRWPRWAGLTAGGRCGAGAAGLWV
jgi:hypothetical protein